MGGDGTLSESIQVIAEYQDFRPCTIPIGFLPGGTGNSFLRDFGLTNYETARDRLFSAVEENSIVAIDAGLITYNKCETGDPSSDPGEVVKRITFNMWGVGLIADIPAFAAKLKCIGAFSYTLASLVKILTHKAFSVHAKIDDGEKKYLPCCIISVSNSQYTGGNMKIAPL